MIYELTQSLIFFCLKILSYIFPFSKKMKKFLQFKDDDNFLLSLEHAKRKRMNNAVFWVHVSSAGELDLFIPIAEKLHQKFGAYFFLTYFSPSALPFVNNVPYLLCHCGFPKDKKSLFIKAFKMLEIKKVFFVRYDIWPKFLEAAIECHVDCHLVSATISKKRSFLSHITQYFYLKSYKKFKTLFVVTQKDEDILKKACPNSHVVLAGDAKWSRVIQKSLKTQEHLSQKVKRLFGCLDDLQKATRQKILIFASPHREELEILRQVTHLKGFFFICVPQDVETASLQALMHNYIHPTVRVKHSTSYETLDDTDLLLVDEVGFLSQIYNHCDLTVVGGGFSGKPHNVIEPAFAGSPILVGQRLSRAPEAEILLSKNCLKAFQSQESLISYLTQVNDLILSGGDAFLSQVKKDFIGQKERELFFKSLPKPEEKIASFLN